MRNRTTALWYNVAAVFIIVVTAHGVEGGGNGVGGGIRKDDAAAEQVAQGANLPTEDPNLTSPLPVLPFWDGTYDTYPKAISADFVGPPAEEARGRRAYVTMVSPTVWGGRYVDLGLALVGSLRETKASKDIDVVVAILVADSDAEKVGNSWTQSSAAELLGSEMHAAFVAAGVSRFVVWGEMPQTRHMPLEKYWKQAFSKLRVWGLVQYEKVVFMDADTLALRNLDHLFDEPEFTAAATWGCSNARTPRTISGGLWVLRPSMHTMKLIESYLSGRDPCGWRWRMGDMTMPKVLFTDMGSYLDPRRNPRARPMSTWPLYDGDVDGLRVPFSPFVGRTGRCDSVVEWPDRFDSTFSKDRIGGVSTENMWRPLNSSYDVLVGVCDEDSFVRDDKPDDRYRKRSGQGALGWDRWDAFSVHFSCGPKPGRHGGRPCTEDGGDGDGDGEGGAGKSPPTQLAPCVADMFSVWWRIFSKYAPPSIAINSAEDSRESRSVLGFERRIETDVRRRNVPVEPWWNGSFSTYPTALSRKETMRPGVGLSGRLEVKQKKRAYVVPIVLPRDPQCVCKAKALVISLLQTSPRADIEIVVAVAADAEGGAGLQSVNTTVADRWKQAASTPANSTWFSAGAHLNTSTTLTPDDQMAFRSLGVTGFMSWPLLAGETQELGRREPQLTRLRVWQMMAYDRIVMVDPSTFVLKNLDHLFDDKTLATLGHSDNGAGLVSSFSWNCGNANSPKTIGRGIWIVEPSSLVWGAIEAYLAGRDPCGWQWRNGDVTMATALFTDMAAYLDPARNPTARSKGTWPRWDGDVDGIIGGATTGRTGRCDSTAVWPQRFDEHPDKGIPEGSTWKTLNASYDVLVSICADDFFALTDDRYGRESKGGNTKWARNDVFTVTFGCGMNPTCNPNMVALGAYGRQESTVPITSRKISPCARDMLSRRAAVLANNKGH